MSARELPDVETLVVKHLQADETLRTAGLKMVAGPAFPEDPKWPWVRVHRSGGPAPIPFWLDGGRCQIDVWGTDDTTQLRSITSKVFASLQSLVGVHEGGVVTGVEETVGRAYIPGETSRHRYLFEIRVFAHPLPRAPEPSITIEEEGARVARLREPVDISEEGTVITTAGG